MPTVNGIGGVFFRARDPRALAEWYETHFGISKVPQDYDSPVWQQAAGPTVFAPFPMDTDYFGRPDQAFMLNFRISDMQAAIAALRDAGIAVDLDATAYPNGRFAHLTDPEGNRIELWEPAAG